MNRLQLLANQIGDGFVRNNPAEKGSLTIIDNRTGKRYEVAVSNNTIRSVDLKNIKDSSGAVLKAYDPGFMNTISCTSRISYIDGDKGILSYRGYPIQQLANSASFVEVAFLLFFGELPTTAQLGQFSQRILENAVLPERVKDILRSFHNDAHPMGVFVSAMAAMGTCFPDANPSLAGQDIYATSEIRNRELFRVMGAALTIAANIARHQEGLDFCSPRPDLGFTENFLYMVDKKLSTDFKPHPKIVRAMDILFILHAEHELNCSTSAVRHLASSNVDVYTAIAGAIGALYGPRHGGANEAVIRMLEGIGTVDKIPQFIEDVKNRKALLMGFGHRVYKSYDPRAKIVKQIAEDVFSVTGKLGLIDVAVQLEQSALQDAFFKKRNLYPNVDFYSGLIYKALGFPKTFFPVFFSLARVSGWLSHWAEFQKDPENRIVRPFQLYKGPADRSFIHIENRKPKVHNKQLEAYSTVAEKRRNQASA